MMREITGEWSEVGPGEQRPFDFAKRKSKRRAKEMGRVCLWVYKGDGWAGYICGVCVCVCACVFVYLYVKVFTLVEETENKVCQSPQIT